MIDLYSGTPGSGKSLHAVRSIKEYYDKGRYVITNFDLSFNSTNKKSGKHLYMQTMDIKPDRLARITNLWEKQKKRRVKEEEILLVVDECQLIFNTRQWSDRDRFSWISFFSQHRKLGYHVILIAQSDMMIDKQIRVLIEYEYIHRKVGNIGKSGKLVSLIMGGQTFVCVQMFKSMKLKIGHEFFSGSSELYNMYNTFSQF